MKINIFFLMSLSFLWACGPQNPSIEGFDDYVWKRDKYGCSGERAKMQDAILGARETILGMSEAEVMRLLGRADEQEVYSRNQKFLIYYLEPNKKCTNPEDVKATAKALHVRISAIGVANELYVSTR